MPAQFDLVVLGSGVAGLSAAVHAANAGQSVLVLTKGELAHSATRYAQGGVAAALFDDDDSPELHLSDTLAAGAGLCDADAVRVLATEGPDRVRELMAMGAEFDRTGDGQAATLALAREGGHSVARVVHAGGDATGAEIERALVAAATATAAEVRERWLAVDLLVEDGRAAGVRAIDPSGAEVEVRSRHTMLATGGAGQCFAVTTNPSLSTGDGIAMALRAGVAVADVEFMQFHPTALHHPSMPRPLLSEALRGEGAVLRDEHGVAFMADEHPLGDLAPRDVVARAITRRLNDRGLDHLWLDATSIDGFTARFPTISNACHEVGLDPTRDWLPVAPAAHYLSGGVCTDLDGAATLPGLWACGEAACSGVHGANRLASNSLLDGLVFAKRAVDAIEAGKDGADATGVMRGVTARAHAPAAAVGRGTATRTDVQQIMTRDAGVLRDAASLERATKGLGALPGPSSPDVQNLMTVSAALVRAATARGRSRGTHTRLDFPERSSDCLGRFVFAGGEPGFVPLAAPAPEPAPMTDLDPPIAVVRDVVRRALAEDLGALGDLTSIAVVPEDDGGTGRFVARASGVIAGTAAATETFAQVDPTVSVAWSAIDGAAVDDGDELGRVAGPLRSLLAAERTALNLLTHCSGIATLTRRFVDAVTGTGARIRDTRKTLPGLRALEKAAVRAGGGFNHRESLSDAVLIKDNHLAHLPLREAVERARARWPGRVVEVECDSLDQVAEAKAIGPDLVLVDNMTPNEVTEAVAALGGALPVEVSGGVTLETVRAYAEAGADFVSVGAITHSAPALDIALDLL